MPVVPLVPRRRVGGHAHAAGVSVRKDARRAEGGGGARDGVRVWKRLAEAHRAEDADAVMAAVAEARKQGLVTAAYGRAIAMMGRHARAGDAVQILDWLEEDECPPRAVADAIAYNATLSACGSDVDAATGVLARAVARGVADVITANAYVNCLAKAGRWRDAVKTLDAMGAEANCDGTSVSPVAAWLAETSPDARTVVAAINACAHAGRWRFALSVARRAGDADVRVHNAALAALSRARRWREATAHFAAIPTPDTVSARTAVYACVGFAPGRKMNAACGAARLRAARHVLRLAHRRCENSDPANWYPTYHALIQFASATSRARLAQSHLDEMRRLGIDKGVLKAEATVTVNRTVITVRNGPRGVGANEVRALVADLKANAGFEHIWSALPHGLFSDMAGQAAADARRRAAESLTHHAEKKALALVLAAKRHGAITDTLPAIEVNIRMCADCVKCFACAARLHRVTVTCVEVQSNQAQNFAPDGKVTCTKL